MIKLLENEIKIIKEVEDITLTDYEIKNDYIDSENLINAIEELLNEYKHLKDKLKDFEQYVQDNYKKINREEQIYG